MRALNLFRIPRLAESLLSCESDVQENRNATRKQRRNHVTVTNAILAAALLAASGSQSAIAGDIVLDWNQISTEVFTANETYQTPGHASRAMAMMNLAIYDSFTYTSPRFSKRSFFRYDGDIRKSSKASGEVAAAQAAYTVLSSLYSDQQSLLDSHLANSLSNYADNRSKEHGIALGTQIGNAIVAARARDGFDSNVQYQPTYEVGRWQPDPVNPGQEAWGPAWGQVTPFALKSVDRYLPPPTPDLTSQAFADSYNEVKALGAVDSSVRTAEQTEVGLFWAYDRVGLGTPLSLYNDTLRTVAEQQGNTTAENAKLFAKASVAMADAAIVAWNAKFDYDYWRPVTGIRDGDLDGNPLTEADPNWTPLGAPDGVDEIGFTPPFPTYISGHATFGGALFESLIEFYGTDNIEFSLSSEELSILMADPELQELYGLSLEDAERTFSSFSEAMAENGRSRVYLGIHWDFDDILGQEVGQDVAQAVFDGRFESPNRRRRGRRGHGLAPGVQPAPEPASVVLLAMGLTPWVIHRGVRALRRRRAGGRRG